MAWDHFAVGIDLVLPTPAAVNSHARQLPARVVDDRVGLQKPRLLDPVALGRSAASELAEPVSVASGFGEVQPGRSGPTGPQHLRPLGPQ